MSDNKKIFRAGIIPYFVNSNGIVQFLFMKPSDDTFGGGDWQIAKGRVEDDEDNLTTALREGGEELGLKEENILEVEELGMFLGRTTFYMCEIIDQKNFNDHDDETGGVNWMTYDEFSEQGRKIHRGVVTSAYSRIRVNLKNKETM